MPAKQVEFCIIYSLERTWLVFRLFKQRSALSENTKIFFIFSWERIPWNIVMVAEFLFKRKYSRFFCFIYIYVTVKYNLLIVRNVIINNFFYFKQSKTFNKSQNVLILIISFSIVKSKVRVNINIIKLKFHDNIYYKLSNLEDRLYL